MAMALYGECPLQYEQIAAVLSQPRRKLIVRYSRSVLLRCYCQVNIYFDDVVNIMLILIRLSCAGAFHIAVQPDPTTGQDPLTDAAEGSDIQKLSHGVRSYLWRASTC